jgi:nitric oxide dioxygenase
MPNKYEPLPLSCEQRAAIREDFVRLECLGEIFAVAFYQRLFSSAPEVRSLFNSDIESQGRKLMLTLRHLVAALDRWESVLPEVKALGRRHSYYGVRSEHYPIVGKALLESISEVLGPNWPGESEAGWRSLYGAISQVMWDSANQHFAESCDTARFFRNG